MLPQRDRLEVFAFARGRLRRLSRRARFKKPPPPKKEKRKARARWGTAILGRAGSDEREARDGADVAFCERLFRVAPDALGREEISGSQLLSRAALGDGGLWPRIVDSSAGHFPVSLDFLSRVVGDESRFRTISRESSNARAAVTVAQNSAS